MPSTVAAVPNNVIRLIGLTEAECRLIAAVGERMVALGLAERVVSGGKRDGIASVSIWSRRGRHFVVHRRRGEVLLVGLHGRVLARSRRFDSILYALRGYAESDAAYATP